MLCLINRSFKSLAGLSDDIILSYLRKIECAADILKTAKEIETRKRMEVLQVLVVQRTGSSTLEVACDKFVDLSEKLEHFKGKYSTNRPLIMKFHTRAFGIIFHRAVVFLTITYSKFHTLSSFFLFT